MIFRGNELPSIAFTLIYDAFLFVPMLVWRFQGRI